MPSVGDELFERVVDALLPGPATAQDIAVVAGTSRRMAALALEDAHRLGCVTRRLRRRPRPEGGGTRVYFWELA